MLVRRDLPSDSYIAVQAAHAASMLAFRLAHAGLPEEEWGDYGPHFVFLGVQDEAELEQWRSELGDCALAYTEPDLGDELTALAYYGARPPGFGRLRLL